VATEVDRCKAFAAGRGLDLVYAAASHSDVGEVEAALSARVVQNLAAADAPTVTRVRHRQTLEQALAELDRALAPDRPAELVAEDVRLVSRALARLAGRIGAEDVLDHVFAAFCIGK
jgi:tRNA modification GTPase